MAANSGTYLLLLHFEEPRDVQVGKLGTFRLGPLAAYAGSAKRGLEKRVARHTGGDKKPYWHVDYATLAADRVEAVPRPDRFDECALARGLMALPGAEVVRGFGNGDCEEGCAGHLVRLPVEEAEGARALALRGPPSARGA